jgi:hypothetical protein
MKPLLVFFRGTHDRLCVEARRGGQQTRWQVSFSSASKGPRKKMALIKFTPSIIVLMSSSDSQGLPERIPQANIVPDAPSTCRASRLGFWHTSRTLPLSTNHLAESSRGQVSATKSPASTKLGVENRLRRLTPYLPLAASSPSEPAPIAVDCLPPA